MGMKIKMLNKQILINMILLLKTDIFSTLIYALKVNLLCNQIFIDLYLIKKVILFTLKYYVLINTILRISQFTLNIHRIRILIYIKVTYKHIRYFILHF